MEWGDYPKIPYIYQKIIMSFIKKIQDYHRPLGDGDMITNRKAKKARTIREGVIPMQNEDGSHSTHVMSFGESGNKKYPYEVNPTIFPNEGGKTWINLSNEPNKAYDEANKRGEVFGFKSAKRAEKFSYGSWKKGIDRKESMKNYRTDKKEGRLYTQSKEFKNRIK